MDSHDKLFTLFFKTREKAVLAKGEDLNYINDFPQDLYYLNNTTGSIFPLITYDWFPKKVKDLGTGYGLPIFPEDFAYYLLSDNENLIMKSAITVKSKLPKINEVNILGPVLAPITKLRKKYRCRILVRYPKNLFIQKYLSQSLNKIKLRPGIKLEVDVDPTNFS